MKPIIKTIIAVSILLIYTSCDNKDRDRSGSSAAARQAERAQTETAADQTQDQTQDPALQDAAASQQRPTTPTRTAADSVRTNNIESVIGFVINVLEDMSKDETVRAENVRKVVESIVATALADRRDIGDRPEDRAAIAARAENIQKITELITVAMGDTTVDNNARVAGITNAAWIMNEIIGDAADEATFATTAARAIVSALTDRTDDENLVRNISNAIASFLGDRTDDDNIRDAGRRNVVAAISSTLEDKTEEENVIHQEFYKNMVFVRRGTFTMGCTPEQGDDCQENEKPARRVTINKDYYISKHPVTQRQWRLVMGNTANPSFFKGNNHPVENVSWNEAQEFVRRLNRMTGKTYRLPTEAEWEYAARGGARSRGHKYAGSGDLGQVAWYYRNSGEAVLDGRWDMGSLVANKNRTHPVGRKRANELGLHDMSGNVWEWTGDANGAYRVFRGGAWNGDENHARVSRRNTDTPDRKGRHIGLRLAMTP